jgi:hypothetical protein
MLVLRNAVNLTGAPALPFVQPGTYLECSQRKYQKWPGIMSAYVMAVTGPRGQTYF